MVAAPVTEIPWGLTERWTRLPRRSEGQLRFWNSKKRIQVVPVPRRSGKTAIVKRKLTSSAFAMSFGRDDVPDGRFVFSAPVLPQAKAIYWDDTKALVPPAFMARDPHETDLEVRLIGGTKIEVRSLDKPQRIEGSPLDGIVVDEFGDVKKDAWEKNIRPALSTTGRLGFAMIIGVPRGGVHGRFARLVNDVQTGQIPNAEVFRWPCSDVVDPAEIEEARRTLDPLMFRQEYGGQFTDFGTRACYTFERARNVAELAYDPRLPLIFCFDFNRKPGIAVVVQEQGREALDGKRRYASLPSEVGAHFTAVIGEVWIRESTTPAVCRRLMEDWAHHRGDVLLYGDLTGGSRSRIDESGSSDWDVILDRFRAMRHWDVCDMRHRIGTGRANPPVESRLNALNARCFNEAGVARLVVDAREDRAAHVAMDLEGTLTIEGSGEIDKTSNPSVSHMLDGLSYYVVAEHPIDKQTPTIQRMRY